MDSPSWGYHYADLRRKKGIFLIYADLMGLECSKHAENIINRKVTIFYIETVLNFFFQLRKIFFLRSIEKKYRNFNDFLLKNNGIYPNISNFCLISCSLKKHCYNYIYFSGSVSDADPATDCKSGNPPLCLKQWIPDRH